MTVRYLLDSIESAYLRKCITGCDAAAPYYSIDNISFQYSCTTTCGSNIYLLAPARTQYVL